MTHIELERKADKLGRQPFSACEPLMLRPCQLNALHDLNPLHEHCIFSIDHTHL
jgi:hypothetical protein